MMPDFASLQGAVLTVATTIIAIGILQNAIYLFQMILAYIVLRGRGAPQDATESWWTLSDVTLPISLLVPAYNEEATIAESVRSLLALHYPNFEVIVINDGSTDATLDTLIDAFQLESVHRSYEESVEHRRVQGLYGSSDHPRLLVVDKENGGKADALNTGISLARMPLFCAVDADSVLEADSLLRVIQPFVDDPERVVAVGGAIRLANGSTIRAGRVVSIGLPTNPLALLQTMEYLRAFLMARLAWSRMNALMLIFGAFGVFRRDIAVAVGGYSHGTVGEDLEIIVKIHRHLRDLEQDYEILFVPEPVCWTEAPESLAMLAQQRKRWQRGSLETFFKHAAMLGNPRYGMAGVVGFTNILIADILAPPIEALGYVLMLLIWWSGLLDWEFFAAYLALTFSFGIFISLGSLILEEMELKRFPRPLDLIILSLVAVAENFGYRQLNNIWRIQGWWQFLTRKGEWGEMTRKGFR